MRSAFLPCLINFEVVTLDTINAPEFWVLKPQLQEIQIVARKHNPNAVNIYITHALLIAIDGTFESRLGLSQLYSNRIFLTGHGASKWWPHELGHAFGLWHTFDTQNGKENIDQSGLNGCEVNALYTGDGIADTPADYEGTMGMDQCNKSNYNPDKQNIMSYWNATPQHFSPDQVKLMHANLTVYHGRYMLNENPFNFKLETRLADGGTTGNLFAINDYNYLYDYQSTFLLPGETYSSFVFNTQANGEQHHDWNGVAVDYRPKEYFLSLASQPVRSSKRKPLFSLTPSGSIQEINLPFSTSIGFQDPWETKDQTTFNILSAAKDIFINERVNNLDPLKPYYQIKADAMKSFGVFCLSFQNWSGTNIDPLTNPNSLAPQPLVTNGIATITANYKAMLASLNTGWVTGNQFVSENGTASVMYVSDGKLWLHRKNGSDMKEILVSSSISNLQNFSATANGNNRYWVLNNGTTTLTSGHEINGVVSSSSVPALSGIPSGRVEIVRINSITPKLALIAKIGSTIYKSVGTLTGSGVTWGSWSTLTGQSASIQVAGNGNLAYVVWINGSSVLGYRLKTDGTWSSAKMITTSSSGSFASMASSVDPNGNLNLILVRTNTQTNKKDLGTGAWYTTESTLPFTVLATSGTYGDFSAISLACEGSKKLASVAVSSYVPNYSYYLWLNDGTSWVQSTSTFASSAQKLLQGEVDFTPSENSLSGLSVLGLTDVLWPGTPAPKVTTGSMDIPVLSISGVQLTDTLIYSAHLDPSMVDSILIDTLGVWTVAVKGDGFVTETVNDLKLFGTSELVVYRDEAGTRREIRFIPDLTKWDVWVVDPSGNKVRMSKSEAEETGGEEIRELVAVYPNPFNPETRISVRLTEAKELKVRVYNLVGQLVADLASGTYERGDYAFRFDGRNLASGTYFYRVEIGTEVKTGKIQLLK
ncbi:MAG: zinc-dependent metalloprotease [Bacteroidetes bacterium]|nr:zinc-dependent metalloprotease [Bacteroidota bacterium]